MSASPDLSGVFLRIQRHLDIPAVLSGDVRLCFALSGPGGGEWTLDSTDGGEVRRGLRSPCDCHLACTADDFLRLVDGRLAPRDGFLEGRLMVEGDVGLILRLQRELIRLQDAGTPVTVRR